MATAATTNLTVTSITSGALAVGQVIYGAGIAVGTRIISQTSGPAGGAGVYVVNTTNTVAVAVAMTSGKTTGIYSDAVYTDRPYRVLGFMDINEATPGAWTILPVLAQGVGGEAFTSLDSIGYSQSWHVVTGSRVTATLYYNTTGRPLTVLIAGTFATSLVKINGISIATVPSGSVTFVVPPNASYSVSGISAFTWSELY
jgi:hypothetical protein